MTVWDNVDVFEQEIAEYCGSKYAVAVDSCTNGIFLALKYISTVSDVNYVEVPKYTYVSVPMMCMHAGFEVRFNDREWTGKYRLSPHNVVDAAPMFAKNMHQSGDFTCISFHFKKPISTGMILTDDKEAVEWLVQARYDGRPSMFYNEMLTKPVTVLGYHMYMQPEQAVRGLESFYRIKGQDIISGKSSDYKVDLSKLDVFK